MAIDYLNNSDGRYRNSSQPFALFLAYNPPHTPFEQVPSEYLENYKDKPLDKLLTRPNFSADGQGQIALKQVRNYFAAVSGIDENVGRILQTVDQAGLHDDTIVVFTADHGEMMGSHGLMNKNVWYDESLLVPFLIRWPGRIQAGRDDLLLSVPDIMPSLLALMGEQARIPDNLEGHDYSGMFLGHPIQRPNAALYLYVDPFQPATHGARGLRTHDYTFVVQRQDGKEEVLLYDNRADPYQLEDVSGARPNIVNTLRRELTRMLTATADPWITGSGT